MPTTNHSQPRGFNVFFLTEMWERYGFYVIQTLLVFYLLKRLHLDDTEAYVIVGSFTALAYINCLFGGFIADRLTNYSSAVISGGIMLFCGYSIMSIAHTVQMLTTGLALVTVGTGLLKPNVSSMLSVIYPNKDTRKDAGYTLYYVGIYVGALSGSLFGGYLQSWFGYTGAFLSSAIGSFLSLAVFVIGTKKFNLFDHRRKHVPLVGHIKSGLSILILFFMSYFVLHSEFLAYLYFLIVAIFCLGFLIYNIITHHGLQRRKLIAFLLLILLSVLYWAIYFQQFFSISLCTERACHINIPTSTIPAVESLGVIVFGPIINFIWFYFKDKNKDISIPAKFSLSFLFNSLCFLVLAGGLWYAIKFNIYLSVWFIVFSYLLVAVGELCISPTSLSMVTSLVPERLTSAMMGISLLSIGFGGKLAGILAANAAISKQQSSLPSLQTVYMHSFFIYFLISLATFIIALLLIRYIKKLINVHKV